MMYKTILADPPWPQRLSGKGEKRNDGRPRPRCKRNQLPYQTMTIDQIAALPIAGIAAEDCHLWLWTTNQFLHAGFHIMETWGFKYLAPIHWIKPSGLGNYFIHRTQTLLFGYRTKCKFHHKRYLPNIFEAPTPQKHSRKPEESYQLIYQVSEPPRSLVDCVAHKG